MFNSIKAKKKYINPKFILNDNFNGSTKHRTFSKEKKHWILQMNKGKGVTKPKGHITI
jgi:hypothetical protein